ncbi:hypothetical protein [Methylomonas sp. MgM2]
MDSTLEFLTKQISILQNDADPNDAEFVCYKLGQNDQNTKSYAVNQLVQANAILVSHRTGIYGYGYGIAYIDDDTPCLMHDIAFEEFIDVLGNKELSSEHLAVIIKNCTTDQQIKILSHLENKKLHDIINQLVF